MFGIGANVALIFSGQAIKWASVQTEGRTYTDSLQAMMAMVFVMGLCVMYIYYWMNRQVLTDPRFYDVTQVKKKKKKLKMGFAQSIKYLFSSKYLGCIAVLVIAYGMSINLIEVIWKSQVKLQYPNPMEYSAFMGSFSQFTGIATLFMLFFVSHNVIRRFGWKSGASVTPLVLLITGVAFLSFILFRDSLTGLTLLMGTTPLFMAVIFGATQNILSKSSKYSLFDPTKEMSYIPLDEESKVKGKAAIDVVGARLGKSGGSLVQQVLLGFLPTVTAMAPYVGFIFIAVVCFWLVSVGSLATRYEELVESKEAEKVSAKKEEKQEQKSKLGAATSV